MPLPLLCKDLLPLALRGKANILSLPSQVVSLNCSLGLLSSLMALLWLQFALLLATVPLVAHSFLSVGTGGEEVVRQLSFPFMVSTWALP